MEGIPQQQAWALVCLQREDIQLATYCPASVHAFTVMLAGFFALAAVSEIDKSFTKLGGK